MNQDNKIPTAPKFESHLSSNIENKKNITSSSPKKEYQQEIPEKFHEGHEKDLPDKNSFMSHCKMEQRKEEADKHLKGEDQGIMDKAKYMACDIKDSIVNNANKVKDYLTK
jgi:hypothetical protein